MARIRQKLDRAEWAKLSQDMQTLYVERNGSYVLDTDDAEELRTAFDRRGAELLEAKKKLADLGDVDAAEYARLKEAEAKAIRDKEIERGNFEKLVAQDREQHAAALKKAAEREVGIRAQLEESLIDGELTRAIAAYPGAKVTPILLGAKRSLKLMEIGGRERAVVVNDKGEPRLKAGAKTADDFMGPQDLVTEMRNDKEWAGNFPATNVAPPGSRQTPMATPQGAAKRELIQNLASQVASGTDRVQ